MYFIYTNEWRGKCRSFTGKNLFPSQHRLLSIAVIRKPRRTKLQLRERNRTANFRHGMKATTLEFLLHSQMTVATKYSDDAISNPMIGTLSLATGRFVAAQVDARLSFLRPS